MTQMNLLPDLPPIRFTPCNVALLDLPSDDLLVGPPASEQILEQTRQLGAIIEPIILEEVAKPKKGQSAYVVRRGRRRIKAARAIAAEYIARGDKPPKAILSIPARVMPSQSGFTGILIDANAHAARKDNAAAEVLGILKLMEQGLSAEDVAAVTALPIGTINKRLKLQGLIPVLWEAFLAGKIASGVADRIAGLPESVQKELAETFAANGRLTSADVDAVRRAKAQEMTQQLPWEQFTREPSSRDQAIAAVQKFFASATVPERIAFAGEVMRLAYAQDEAGESLRQTRGQEIVERLKTDENLTPYERQELEDEMSRLMTDEESGAADPVSQVLAQAAQLAGA